MQSTFYNKKNGDNTSNTINAAANIGCIPNINPQQQEFVFEDLTLDSCFDSGNMNYATRHTDNHYNIWVSPDCAGSKAESHHKTWFYFRVRDMKSNGNNSYTFTIKSMSTQVKLFNEGLLPVYKAIPSSPEWQTIKPQPLQIQSAEKGTDISFNHIFNPNDKEIFFAYTYPWSYSDDQEQIDKYEQDLKNDSDIYFHRELLVHSREKRRVELITITSHTNKLNQKEKAHPELFPDINNVPRANIFSNKKYVFISSRVHPGETPASYVFNSFLKFLLSKDDTRAKALREQFVFVLVPMLNPDGVYRGHYRLDTHGLNLNRYYIEPNIDEHPTVYATKEIIMELNSSKRLFLYCDIHAHAGKKGCFIFGNKLEFKQQVDSMLFAKLLSINSQYFEFASSSFSESNVKLKDKKDGEDKEGAGRVALYKATNLPYCYTLECNYNSGTYRNVLSKLVEVSTSSNPPDSSRDKETSAREEAKENGKGNQAANLSPERLPCTECYTYKVFEEVGEAIGPALLDLIEANPITRLKSSCYKSLRNLKISLAQKVMKDPANKVTVYLTKDKKAKEINTKEKGGRLPVRSATTIEKKPVETKSKPKAVYQKIALNKDVKRFEK